MNKTFSLILKIVLGLVLLVSLILGVYYYTSYKSEANEVADIINKGNSYMEANLYDKAIESYEMALEHEQGDKRLISAIVQAYMLLGDENGESDEAIICYEKAISYDTNNKTAYWAIANIYENRGEEDTMMDVLRRGYLDTNDESMNSKVMHIEDERARIKAEEEEQAAIEAEKLAIEQARADMLEPLVELFKDKDYDSLKEKLRTEAYVDFSDEVIGDASYYFGDYSDSGKREGIGLAVYENGYYYYGEYKDDVRSGDGIYFRASYSDSSSIGSFIFEGKWENDAPNGQGSATSNYYKDRISASDFSTKVISGNYSDGLEDGDMTLEGKTRSGAARKFTYKAQKGVAQKSSNEDSGVKGQYIIAQSGNDNLTSDGSKRGVESFVEEE